jgi:hypothetical protein
VALNPDRFLDGLVNPFRVLRTAFASSAAFIVSPWIGLAVSVLLPGPICAGPFRDRPTHGAKMWPLLSLLLLISVAAIFVAVFVLDAEFHATARATVIVVASAIPIPLHPVPVAIPSFAVPAAVHVTVATCLAVTMHSPVTADLPVIAANTVAFARTHPPVASHFTIVGFRLIAAVSLFLLLLLGALISLGRNCLRGWKRSFSFLLGE